MKEKRFAPHEGLELHEILNFKNVCLTKAITMSLLVSDEELKGILQKDADTTKQHIEEIKAFMEKIQATDSTDPEVMRI
jgi:similar to spore coat protein